MSFYDEDVLCTVYLVTLYNLKTSLYNNIRVLCWVLGIAQKNLISLIQVVYLFIFFVNNVLILPLYVLKTNSLERGGL